MESKQHDKRMSGEWLNDGTALIELGPFDIESLRWTKGSGLSAASNALVNQATETYAPIYMCVFNHVFEVKPSSLYLAIDSLPLEGASDEALRASVALREQVIEDLKKRAWNELEDAITKK